MKHPYLEALMILIISVPYLLIVAPILSLFCLFIQFFNGELRTASFHYIWEWPLRLARGDTEVS